MRGVFKTRELPKPEYRALQWLTGELDCDQWTVVCLGVRLLALLQQGSLNIQALHERGQQRAVADLLEAFRAQPKDQNQRDHVAPPHAKVKNPPAI